LAERQLFWRFFGNIASKPEFSVIGIIAATPNMISGNLWFPAM